LKQDFQKNEFYEDKETVRSVINSSAMKTNISFDSNDLTPVHSKHRCTVVGNPGGGGVPWGGQIHFRGYLGLSENLEGPLYCLYSCLLHFYVSISWTLPPPPSPTVCIFESKNYE
jgi:hypothetical protein